MEVGVWCGAGILVLYNIVLQIKVYLLRKSAKEIRKDSASSYFLRLTCCSCKYSFTSWVIFSGEIK